LSGAAKRAKRRAPSSALEAVTQGVIGMLLGFGVVTAFLGIEHAWESGVITGAMLSA
jgi:predicted membrane protein